MNLAADVQQVVARLQLLACSLFLFFPCHFLLDGIDLVGVGLAVHFCLDFPVAILFSLPAVRKRKLTIAVGDGLGREVPDLVPYDGVFLEQREEVLHDVLLSCNGLRNQGADIFCVFLDLLVKIGFDGSIDIVQIDALGIKLPDHSIECLDHKPVKGFMASLGAAARDQILLDQNRHNSQYARNIGFKIGNLDWDQHGIPFADLHRYIDTAATRYSLGVQIALTAFGEVVNRLSHELELLIECDARSVDLEKNIPEIGLAIGPAIGPIVAAQLCHLNPSVQCTHLSYSKLQRELRNLEAAMQINNVDKSQFWT